MARRRVSFIITAKNKGFIKALDQSGRRLRRFGFKMERMGRSLTQNITMPVAAAGGAAIKMASDFEKSLSQAQAQANLTADQVSFIGDSAKEMAKRTGESTDDIIEAYKFTVSAGMSLAESQKIVGAAAEASAAGFGEQRDLVRLTTTAMQAYSDELDSGRQFMDMLVGAAQVMEIEVSKLGPAFQRNVGVAKQLNIGMEELFAGIGSVSEIMGDAQRGGRLFQTMITKLLNPTGKAKEVITGVFGSLRNMHRSIRDEGLLKTMLRLRQELEATSEEGLGLVFSQRSLEAALNFTNREGDRTSEIMKNMGDTAGSTKSAFDDVSDTTERRFRKALRNLQVAAIELGQIMLPIVNDIIEVVSDWVTRFSELDKATQQNVVQTAAYAAALGPMLIVGGKVIKMLGSMQKGVAGLATAFKTGSLAIWGWIGALSALGVANFKANQRSQDRIDAISEEVKQIESVEEANKKIVEIESERARLQRQMAKGARGLGKELEDLNQRLQETIMWRNELAAQDIVSDTGGSPSRPASTSGTTGDGGGRSTSLVDQVSNIGRVSAVSTEVARRNLDNMRASVDNTTDALVGQAIAARKSGEELSKGQKIGAMFGETMADAFAQAALHGRNLLDVLENIGKQLAARGFVKAIGMLLTGGFSGGFNLGSLVGSIFGVNDALVTSRGDVIQFHPDDDILAMKDFGNLQSSVTGKAQVNVFMDSRLVDQQLVTLENKRGR